MLESTIKKESRNIFGFLFDLIFPKYCLGCGSIGVWLCDRCLREKLYLELSELEFDFNESVDRLYYIANFNDPLVANIVKSCKYQGVKDLASFMGQKIACEFQDSRKIKHALIMPVPLHHIRQRTRGFNQAELMAREILKLNVGIQIKDLVERRVNSKPQAQLSRAGRLNNLENAFCFSGNVSLKNIDLVVVVDDVITTGTTINELAKLLKKAGVKEVWGVAFAHGL